MKDLTKSIATCEKEREAFLCSQEAIEVARQEVLSIIEKLKKLKPVIEATSELLNLDTTERQHQPMFELGYDGYFLCFNNSRSFIFEGNSGVLKIILYKKNGQQGSDDYKEHVHKQVNLRFDRDLEGNNGWSDHNTGKNFHTTDELINKWVNLFIDDIGKSRKTPANSTSI
jgi:hypothetical protein